MNKFCFLLLLFQLRDVIEGKAWSLCRKYSAGNLHRVTKRVGMCAFKGIKVKLSSICGKQNRKCVFCSVLFQEQYLFNSKQQRAQTWLLCDHAEDVILLFSHCAKKTMSVAHQALRYGLSVCWYPQPSLSPAGSSAHMFPLWGQSWPRAQRKQAALWGCQGQFRTCLLLQEESVWEGKAGLFYPCFGGAQGLGCFGTQASHCLPTRCALSNTGWLTSSSHFATEAAQLFGYFLYYFTEERCSIMSTVTSTLFFSFCLWLSPCGV